MSDHEYPHEFLQALPKTDLHVHLDGSLRLETLIELARERDVKLPSYTSDGLARVGVQGALPRPTGLPPRLRLHQPGVVR